MMARRFKLLMTLARQRLLAGVLAALMLSNAAVVLHDHSHEDTGPASPISVLAQNEGHAAGPTLDHHTCDLVLACGEKVIARGGGAIASADISRRGVVGLRQDSLPSGHSFAPTPPPPRRIS